MYLLTVVHALIKQLCILIVVTCTSDLSMVNKNGTIDIIVSLSVQFI
jgi:hypothetical protein